MKPIYIFSLAALFGLVSCANEAPFEYNGGDGTGKVLTQSLKVQVKTDESVVRASSDVPGLNDFTVSFVNSEQGETASYKYSALPEVVTLPTGDYTVYAFCGGDATRPDKSVAFSAPYYKGVSNQFTIAKNKIVDNIDPIVCKLSNVKVSIFFDADLVKRMSEDSKVSVEVGHGNKLDFVASTEESGYFEFVDQSEAGSEPTLVASFSGNVDGDRIEENKVYQAVQPGTHYKITFKLHAIDPSEPGEINPGEEGEEIKVDAVVKFEDYAGNEQSNITPENEIYLVDDRYPQGEEEEPNEPGPGEPAGGPKITAASWMNLNDWNIYEEGVSNLEVNKWQLFIHSDTGIIDFIVDIESEKLTPDELNGVGLDSHLDMVNPGDLAEPLSNLGFPVNVGGENDVTFDITGFMPMMAVLKTCDHEFKLKVTDESGTTEKILKIRVK